MYQFLVFEGSVKFSIIEARMNMELGGVLRQTLRTGMQMSVLIINFVALVTVLLLHVECIACCLLVLIMQIAKVFHFR